MKIKSGENKGIKCSPKNWVKKYQWVIDIDGKWGSQLGSTSEIPN